jgi:hypothetical protein
MKIKIFFLRLFGAKIGKSFLPTIHYQQFLISMEI